ncbi:MAG: hypothetical protein IPP37_17450 [Saprospiraceae bacterium]|nr:hypothetical protein [Saprospiraceae bacterium]
MAPLRLPLPPVGQRGTWNGQDVNPALSIAVQLKTDATYTYQYCVNDNSISNCQACKEKKITIHSLPQPIFVKDSTNCIGEVITFTNTTPPGSYDPTTVRWDFGDGITSTSTPSPHAYNVKTITPSPFLSRSPAAVQFAFPTHQVTTANRRRTADGAEKQLCTLHSECPQPQQCRWGLYPRTGCSANDMTPKTLDPSQSTVCSM